MISSPSESFEHVARRPRNQHLAHGALLFEPGERHDLERGVQGLQPARGLDPVHLWHADVHQDDVGSQLVDELDRLDAVRRLADDLEVLAAEEGSERTAEAVVVVDHEDAYATGQGKGALRHVQRVRRAKGSRYPTVVGFLRGTRVWAGWPRPSSRRATGDSPPAWSDGAEPAAILDADVPARDRIRPVASGIQGSRGGARPRRAAQTRPPRRAAAPGEGTYRVHDVIRSTRNRCSVSGPPATSCGAASWLCSDIGLPGARPLASSEGSTTWTTTSMSRAERRP